MSGKMFLVLDLCQISLVSDAGQKAKATLPDGAVGVMFVYADKAKAQTEHPGRQILQVALADSDDTERLTRKHNAGTVET